MGRRIIAKIGGSLFDWPELKSRLHAWLVQQEDHHVLLIPGGGDLADGIRRLHVTHRLEETTSHWLAIRTMTVHAHFLGHLCQLPVISRIDEQLGHAVIDVYPQLLADETSTHPLPHSWKVTSDSIAAHIAWRFNSELVLVKSADVPVGDWESLAEHGFVDRFFPEIIAQTGISVRCVNLRNF